MKVTKFEQSCLKIEHEGKALLVDVGKLSGQRDMKDFGDFEAMLFTHSHPDHFDHERLDELCANGAQAYGNANVAQLAGEHTIEVIEDGEELVIAGIKVKAFHMEHCLMWNDQPAGIPNTGFLINDRLLLPGDSTEDIGITAEVVALPVFGPDISYRDAFVMARNLKAKTIFPVHFDVTGARPDAFSLAASHLEGVAFKPLGHGESLEI